MLMQKYIVLIIAPLSVYKIAKVYI
jgi:hypothetical protein